MRSCANFHQLSSVSAMTLEDVRGKGRTWRQSRARFLADNTESTFSHTNNTTEGSRPALHDSVTITGVGVDLKTSKKSLTSAKKSRSRTQNVALGTASHGTLSDPVTTNPALLSLPSALKTTFHADEDKRRSSRLESVTQALRAEWVIRRPTLLQTILAQNVTDAQLHAEDIATRKFNAFMSTFVQKLGRSTKFRINCTMLLPILLLFIILCMGALATYLDLKKGILSTAAVQTDWTILSIKQLVADATYQNAQLQTRFADKKVRTKCSCNLGEIPSGSAVTSQNWQLKAQYESCQDAASILTNLPRLFAEYGVQSTSEYPKENEFTITDAEYDKIKTNVYNQLCMEIGATTRTRATPPPEPFEAYQALVLQNEMLSNMIKFETTKPDDLADYPVWSMKAYHAIMRAYSAASNLMALSFMIPLQVKSDGSAPLKLFKQQIAAWIGERAKLNLSMNVAKFTLPSAYSFALRLASDTGINDHVNVNDSLQVGDYRYDDDEQFRSIKHMTAVDDAVTKYMKDGACCAAFVPLQPDALYNARTRSMTPTMLYPNVTAMFKSLPDKADEMVQLIAPLTRQQLFKNTLILYGSWLVAAMFPLATASLLVSRRIITRFITDIHMCIQQDHDSSVLLHLQEVRLNHILFSMLPRSMVQNLKYRKVVRPQYFESVTLFFSDVQGFTELSSRSTPYEIVNMLTIVYTIFDEVLSDYDAFKVETIGDAYSVISGAPDTLAPMKHASEVAKYALEIVGYMLNDSWVFRIPHKLGTSGERLKIRIGLHTGPITTGIAGVRVHRFILIGETFELVQKVEANGAAQRVHISESTKRVLDEIGGYECSPGNNDGNDNAIVSVHGNKYATYFVEFYDPVKAIELDVARESIIDAFCTEALAPASHLYARSVVFDRCITPSGVQIPHHVWTAMHTARRIRNRRSQVVKLVSRMVQNGLVSEKYYENIAREFDKCVFVDDQGQLQVVIEEQETDADNNNKKSNEARVSGLAICGSSASWRASKLASKNENIVIEVNNSNVNAEQETDIDDDSGSAIMSDVESAA